MKKLTRTKKPECLLKYNHSKHTWNDVTTNDKALIWEKLYEMQGNFCAYCENHINKRNHHIEHFARKKNNKTLTFEWSNLFGSCDEKKHCGHYKDHGAGEYLVENLIKPDETDPNDYLFFTFSGMVYKRKKLSYDDQTKADETIRVFNLNAPLLQKSRENVINKFKDIFKELKSFLEDNDMNISEEDKLDFINGYLSESISKGCYAHQSAIKSVFFSEL